MNASFCIISAVNSEEVYSSCLGASPEVLKGAIRIAKQYGFSSASSAYNAALDKCETDALAIFAHQDIYFPDGWIKHLEAGLHWLDQNDPNWGVLGIYGVNQIGNAVGWTYSTGLGKILGGMFPYPQQVRTLDEVVLIIRKSKGLRFDTGVKGFHMYGTDLCLEAQRRGLHNYVLPAFAIHNSNGIRNLPLAFWQTYLYVRRKWWKYLPVAAPCARVDRSFIPMLSAICQRLKYFGIYRRQVGQRVADPAALYQKLVQMNMVQT